MKVLSKSSGGAFEPSPSPPLLLHDLISRQIHLSRATRIPQTEPGGRTGYTGISRTKSMERTRASGPPLRAVFSLPPDYGGRKRVDELTFRRRGFPSAKGVATLRGCTQPPRAWKGTPRLSTNRLRPLATPGRAISRLGVFRREGDQRRRVLATPAPGYRNGEP